MCVCVTRVFVCVCIYSGVCTVIGTLPWQAAFVSTPRGCPYTMPGLSFSPWDTVEGGREGSQVL